MATTYNVYRDGAKIKSGLTTTTFTDTGLTAGKEYAYQVSSVNEVGESPLSEKAFVTIVSMTLDVNGTVKTGTFAKKTLDEDAYDDLTVKDSNTVYKVYPEGGNPDEAAWFLGEQPVDSAKEGDTVVYNRNYFSNSKLLSLAVRTEKHKYEDSQIGRCVAIKVSEGETVAAKKYKESDRLYYTYSRVFPENNVPYYHESMDILNQEQLITTPAPPDMEYVVLTLTIEGRIDFIVKIEKGDKFTIYTVAPEDVAIIPESTGGGAA